MTHTSLNRPWRAGRAAGLVTSTAVERFDQRQDPSLATLGNY